MNSRTRRPRDRATATGLSLALVSLLIGAISAHSASGDLGSGVGITVRLAEEFGVDHPEQVVELAMPNSLPGGAWSLRGANGGSLPVQVLAAPQRIAFQTDLPAGARRQWQLTPESATEAPADPVTLRTNAEYVEIGNRRIGIRLPGLGRPASARPAPLLGLRWQNHSWIGAQTNQISFANSHPEVRIRSLEVRVIDPGPLVATAEVIYTLQRPELLYGTTVLAPDGPGRYLARFRLEAGQPMVLITEETDIPFAWTLELPELRVDQARYRGHHASEARWGMEPDGRVYRPAHERPQMDARMDLPFDRDYLPGWRTSSEDGLFRRLPAWDPWIYDGGWYWQFYDKDGEANSPLLGLFAGPASLARDVGDAGAGLVIRGSRRTIGLGSSAQLRTGSGQLQPKPRFAWGIFAGIKGDLRSASDVQPIAREMNLHAGFNLTKMAALPDDFPDPPQGYGSPFMPREALARLKAALRADQEGIHGHGLAGQLGRKDAPARDLIAFWSKPSAAELAKVTQRAEKLATDLMNALVQADGIYNFRFHYWLGGLEMSRQLLWIDQALDSEQLSPADKAKLKRIAALFGTVLWDNDFVPMDNSRGINLGTPNMPVQQAGYRDQFALFLAGEPAFRARAQGATARVLETLRHDILDNGAHMACVHYIGAGMGPTLTLMQQLQQAKIKDLFTDEPRMASFAEFLMQCATPPEPRFGGLRKQISVGDSASESTELFGQLGTGFASSRPELSRRLMGMWRAEGEMHSSFHGTTLLKIDAGLSSADPALGSASFPGQFTILRHGWGTPREDAVWLLTGNHYVDHAHADEGEVILYLQGAPVSLDWGSMYEPRSSGSLMHSIAIPERLLGWPWDKDSPPVSSGGELWGNYPGTKTTIENFRTAPAGSWVRSRMQAPDKSFTWTRAVSSGPLGASASVVVIQDVFHGDGAHGSKVFTLNLCAEGDVETPSGMVTPVPRLHGYGNRGESRDNPSSGKVFPLPAKINRLHFTGQSWPKHATGGVDFDVYVITDQPQQALIGNWAHAWHPDAEAQQFLNANGRPFEERQHLLRLRGDGGFRVALVAWPKGAPPPRLSVEITSDGLLVQSADSTFKVESSGAVSR